MSESLPSAPPITPLREDSYGAFARGLLLLATLLLATARYGDASPSSVPPPEALRLKRRYDPLLERNCYFFQALGVDYVNDAELLPHALNIKAGTLEPGSAAGFRVLGVTYQGTYPDVTQYFRATRYNSRALRVTVRPAPGSRSVAGKVRLRSASDDVQRILYVPAKTMSVDRTAILTFTLQCDLPLTTEFVLQIPAGR